MTAALCEFGIDTSTGTNINNYIVVITEENKTYVFTSFSRINH